MGVGGWDGGLSMSDFMEVLGVWSMLKEKRRGGVGVAVGNICSHFTTTQNIRIGVCECAQMTELEVDTLLTKTSVLK